MVSLGPEMECYTRHAPSMSSNLFTSPRIPSFHDRGLSTINMMIVDRKTNQSQVNMPTLLCAAHSGAVGRPIVDDEKRCVCERSIGVYETRDRGEELVALLPAFDTVYIRPRCREFSRPIAFQSCNSFLPSPSSPCI